MQRLLQILSLVVALGASAFWLATGAHRGWTQTSVPRKTVDDVTGLEAVTYQQRFVPGLDFLGVAGLGAGALAGGSVLFRKKTQNPSTPSKPNP